MNNCVENKTILFIGPVFYNYHQLIIDTLEKQGAVVSFIPEKEYGFIPKVLKYTGKKLEISYSNFFLKKKINSSQYQNFDYVFVIHGEFVDTAIIKLIREKFNPTKLIAYHWDSFVHNPNGLKTAKLYDKVFSFDRKDSNENEEINYLPLFHTISTTKVELAKPKYDLLFVGVDYSDRIDVVENLKEKCSQKGLLFKSILITSKISFYKKKLLGNSSYKKVNSSDLSFDKLSYGSFLELLQKSNTVLDINVENQVGLTMRTIEVLAMGKKLLTTNEWIKFEPFYSTQNINIIDRKNPCIEKEFFASEAQPNNMKAYHLDNWLKQIFN